MSSTDRPTRYKVRFGEHGRWIVSPDLLAYPEEVEVVKASDYDALETENQRLRKALNYATTDLEPEDVALTWQIANGQWEPDPPRNKS